MSDEKTPSDNISELPFVKSTKQRNEKLLDQHNKLKQERNEMYKRIAEDITFLSNVLIEKGFGMDQSLKSATNVVSNIYSHKRVK